MVRSRGLGYSFAFGFPAAIGASILSAVELPAGPFAGLGTLTLVFGLYAFVALVDWWLWQVHSRWSSQKTTLRHTDPQANRLRLLGNLQPYHLKIAELGGIDVAWQFYNQQIFADHLVIFGERVPVEFVAEFVYLSDYEKCATVRSFTTDDARINAQRLIGILVDHDLAEPYSGNRPARWLPRGREALIDWLQKVIPDYDPETWIPSRYQLTEEE